MDRTDPYRYWGVGFTKFINGEFIGTCPFCESEDHFYVNKTTGAFSCFHCGKEGGVRDFLKFTYEHYLNETTRKDLESFSKAKHIPVAILEYLQVASNCKAVFLPAYDEHLKVTDLRIIVSNKKEQSTKGAKGGLVGLLNLGKEGPVYLCEGITSKSALDWLLYTLNEKGVVLSVGGANHFKDEWLPLFQDREVIVCYDKDDAGNRGFEKVKSKLYLIASSVSCVQWSQTCKKGYDLRDFVLDNIEKPRQCFKLLYEFIVKDLTSPLSSSTKPIDCSLDDIINEAHKIYKLDKTMVDGIKLSLAAAISQRLPGQDNVWLFLVGPPGSGKTLILGMFEAATKVIWTSTLSRSGLVSGWTGDRNDPSILARVNNKSLILKDYTEILALSEKEKKDVCAILRGAYDGRVNRQFGNTLRNYSCNFSMVAGVTHAINAHSTAALGERFLRYNIQANSVDIDGIQEQALMSQLTDQSVNKRLKALVSGFLDRDLGDALKPRALIDRLPGWYVQRIKPLGQLIGLLRTPVARVEYGLRAGQLAYEPVPEVGTRTAIQLEKLGLCLSLIEDKELDEEIYDIVKHIAMDTVSGFSTKLVTYMVSKGELTLEEIIKGTRIRTANYILDDLELVGIVHKHTEKISQRTSYCVSNSVKTLWENACLI